MSMSVSCGVPGRSFKYFAASLIDPDEWSEISAAEFNLFVFGRCGEFRQFYVSHYAEDDPNTLIYVDIRSGLPAFKRSYYKGGDLCADEV